MAQTFLIVGDPPASPTGGAGLTIDTFLQSRAAATPQPIPPSAPATPAVSGGGQRQAAAGQAQITPHRQAVSASGPGPSAVQPPTPQREEKPAPRATAAKPKTHRVRKGDTLTSIARKYNTSWKKLYAANRKAIDNPDSIRAGQKLKVPGKAPKTAAGGTTSSDHRFTETSGGGSTPKPKLNPAKARKEVAQLDKQIQAGGQLVVKLYRQITDQMAPQIRTQIEANIDRTTAENERLGARRTDLLNQLQGAAR